MINLTPEQIRAAGNFDGACRALRSLWATNAYNPPLTSALTWINGSPMRSRITSA